MNHNLGPLYKVLNLDGTCCNGGKNTWDLSGAWMPAIEGDLIPCERGYHLCRQQHLIEWLGPAIYPAEINGEDWIDNGDKIVARQARITGPAFATWTDRTARLFAADCADRVVHLIGPHPDCVRAIAVARQYANGEASEVELTAARAAAWAAAEAAAWAAAEAAARAAAAEAAARAAAEAAARGAAEAAAWAATEAAWAARAAARGAARDAAWAAERKWQAERLLNVLGIERSRDE